MKTILVYVIVLWSLMGYCWAENNSIPQLIKEITQLKQIIKNQENRITQLENEVDQLKTLKKISPTKKDKLSEIGETENGWRNESNWNRIKAGMSESQVITILGQPTSKEGKSGIEVLTYKGHLSGSGFITGNIWFIQGQVVRVDTPVF